jgi:hypothetical protein
MLVSPTFKTTLIIKKLFRQCKVMKDEPHDISGHHGMKLGASELCYYHANCISVVSILIITE